jgi:taurine dioxygenase
MARIADRPLAPFGVQADIETLADLTPADASALVELYQRDGLLLLRNVELTMEQQIDLCSVFGPILRESRENYIVSNVRADGLLGSKELLFHNDVPFVPAPYLGGSLHAIDVDPGVSATRFVSGYRAYERLPAALRDRIDDLNALQVRKRVEGRRSRLTDLLPGDVGTVHPVVRHHPTSGRPFVFVNEDMTAMIVGLSESDSDALLDELFGYLYAPDAVYEHEWQRGDIVIWDNLAVQHARRAVTMPGNRTLQRVTIAEIGYYDQIPTDVASFEKLRTVAQPA